MRHGVVQHVGQQLYRGAYIVQHDATLLNENVAYRNVKRWFNSSQC